MRRTDALWEVFVVRFEDALERYRKRRLTAEEAGELLGMSGRHFRRLTGRYEEDGREGLRDRRLGKVSPRRAPGWELARMQELYREFYGDFTVKHFHEQIAKRHGYTLGYTVTRLSLAKRQVWPARPGAAARTARSGSDGPCRACFCSRTARPIAGLRRSIAISTSWSRSTTRRERSIRRFW